MKTWTSLPESRARSTVLRVPFEVPSQNATRTSQASTNRWLRAAALLASAISSNEAGITWTGMPFSRAAFVAAASTPLALPVMTDARGGSDFTYSATLTGSPKCRLPTIPTFNLARGRSALADHRDVLLEHLAQLRRLPGIVLRIRPAVTCVEHLPRDARHPVRNVQPKDRVHVRRHASEVAVEDRAHDGARMRDRHPLAHAVRTTHPARVQHPHVGAVPLDALHDHVRVALRRQDKKGRRKTR